MRAIVMMVAFIGASLGFLVYNYPNGKIFLGDGGAYMIGFGIAVSSIKMLKVHPEISPYDVLLMAIYPITELGFSIYRKKILRKTSPTKPDGLHLHMLIYKRCTDFHSKHRNPSVVILMMPFIVPQVFFALLFHTKHLYCLVFIAAYIIAYVYIYFRIVHFKTPTFLKVLRHSQRHIIMKRA
jgi:UDP-N-acetylmuramyl pentapeptide phosphotransferase/UDP-N-acetylglucosamine-1-phosphate transferase